MPTNTQPRIDYTSRDYASLREALLELASERLPEWTDHSSNDLGVTLLELFAAMGDAIFYHQDRIAGESYLGTAVERRSVLNLLRLIGYELRPPTPASGELTLLFDYNPVDPVDPGNPVLISIPAGAEFTTTAEATGTPISFRYARDTLSINFDALPTATYKTKLYKVYASLPVTQIDAVISDEIVASSDGSAGQRYALARTPVIEGSAEIYVDDGSGTPALWTQKQSLLTSGAQDIHYVIRRDENDKAWVEFGDDIYGRVPTRWRNNITANYVIGGGKKGNVAPNTITKAITSIDRLKVIYNEKAMSGGAERESIEDAVRRGPQQFRSGGRAVTAADYEAHARLFGVAKARARAKGWNRIELTIAPAGGAQPSDTLKQDLRAYFDPIRMISSNIEIVDPTYVPIIVRAAVEVEPYFFQSQIEERVRTALKALWAFDEVNFQDTLYISKIYEAIEAIEGVAGVNVSWFVRGDDSRLLLLTPPTTALPTDGRLVFGYSEIPLWRDFDDLTLSGGRADD